MSWSWTDRLSPRGDHSQFWTVVGLEAVGRLRARQRLSVTVRIWQRRQVTEVERGPAPCLTADSTP